ncbi:MAG: response regulator transcription factor [Angustibacter sp.]
MRVLVVEDEVKLALLIQRGLTAGGLAADVVHDGRDAVCSAAATRYDAIVLDVLLPDLDGLSVCRQLRACGVATPVLLLTALDQLPDRVAGLDSGADDYLAKPFHLAELLARLRALSRRPSQVQPVVLRCGGLRLDPATHQVSKDGVPISLTVKEFAMLHTLMRRSGQVVSRGELLESAWDAAYDNRSNVVDVYVRYLRTKVDRPFGTSSIRTVRGVGYLLIDPGTGTEAPEANAAENDTTLRPIP